MTSSGCLYGDDAWWGRMIIMRNIITTLKMMYRTIADENNVEDDVSDNFMHNV